MMMETLYPHSLEAVPDEVKPVPWKVAKRIIEHFHYLKFAPAIHKFSLGVYLEGDLCGVLMFSKPCARLEDQENTLELSRMFLFDGPKNSESKALSLAEKWIKQNTEFDRVISYADTEIHAGTIYKAANWKAVGLTRPHTWNSAARTDSRHRRGIIGGKKIKFERIIKRKRGTMNKQTKRMIE